MKPILIFGGTFDPVHIGHLRVALEASEFLDANVRLMPANTPPHRSPPIASAKQRTGMLELAVAGQKNLAVDTRELQRAGPSYTLDTLIELRREFPAEQSIALLLGADAMHYATRRMAALLAEIGQWAPVTIDTKFDE